MMKKSWNLGIKYYIQFLKIIHSLKNTITIFSKNNEKFSKKLVYFDTMSIT